MQVFRGPQMGSSFGYLNPYSIGMHRLAIRKQLHLKAHTVTKVEETDECMRVHIDRLGTQLLHCGACRQRCREVYDVRKQRAVA